ncbi:hypothetical protein HCG49_16775 [Arenibacter sp. 6A1]|uniref:TraG/VirB4 family ATPase n=1 Tax=Arenibacter sp. 6A1 TaxID=2720391 RepID=UPI0014486F20|nr:hypothetical protein [Arenibacter sp. 6A1]NKI28209.1 hypothetical protein [Arenibacter sp. 6A1]
MIVNAQQAYSIDTIVGNTLISTDGNISKVYVMEMPEKYSLSETDFDRQHDRLFKALRSMPVDCWVHKQDIGLVKYYDATYMPENNLLQRAYKEHIHRRKYLQHQVLLIFTLSGLKMLRPGAVKNPLGYRESYQETDRHKIQAFEESIRSCTNIIGQSRIGIVPIDEGELKLYVKEYCNGFTQENTDIDFGPSEGNMDILGNRYEILTVPRQEYLPERITNIIEDFSDQEYVFFKGFLDDLGETFCYNHIYNQILFFKGHNLIKGDIEASYLTHAQNKGWSPTIEEEAGDIAASLKSISGQSANVLVQANFNLILWSDREHELEAALERAKTIFQTNGMEYYRASKITIQNLFLSSIVGRNTLINPKFLFDQPLKQALCLFTNTSNYSSDDTGILYNDRLYGVPVKRDLWDLDKKRIKARNSIKIAPTGAGKSFSMLWEIFQELMAGIVVCLIEIGSSADVFAKLFKDISVQIKFDFGRPLGVNPFKMEAGEEIDNHKIMLLSALCFKFWQQQAYKEDTDTDKAMKKLLRHYYRCVVREHSFPSFYNFVKSRQESILMDLEIEARFFDLGSFLHICDDFLPGGMYENVCAETDSPLEEKIANKQFIHFELSKIKTDPFLVSIMIHLINYVIDNRILKDRSKRAKIKYDEFAETQELRTALSDDHVLASVAFLYQKIRKENGGVDIVIQSPSQLPDNEYTKNIIANHQILHVLEGSNLVYRETKKLLQLGDHDEYLMKSIENNFKGDLPYSEEYLRIGNKYRNIMRLQVPREVYYAFQTEGADWDWMQKDYLQTGDMEQTIMNIIARKHEKVTTT